MSTPSVSTAMVHQVEVPQPKQHGKPGGIMRHLNFFTGLIGGVVLALVFGFLMNLQFPSGALTANFANAAAGPTFWAMMVGWVIGFMGGMGAFTGPIRWLFGRDLTHADAEFMAGKDQGKFRYWRFTTDHKVVGIQYLIVAMIILGFGGLLAMLIRTELGVTWAEVFNPDFYNSLVG
ncbi:MAG: hypothetical protein RL347_1460, partial [Actinomycetota bacterium]